MRNRSAWRSSRPFGKNNFDTKLLVMGSPRNSTSTDVAVDRTVAESSRVSWFLNQPPWTYTVCGQSRKFSRQASTDARKRVRIRKLVQPRSPYWGNWKGADSGIDSPGYTHT